LILNAERTVSETNSANVCCVFGDTACFPTSDHALQGTMAAEVRRLLPRWGFAVEDRRLTVEDLLAADQVFLTNSLMGAVPAISLQDTKLRYDAALCDKINEAVFHGQDAGAASDRMKPSSRAVDAPGSGVRAVVAEAVVAEMANGAGGSSPESSGQSNRVAASA